MERKRGDKDKKRCRNESCHLFELIVKLFKILQGDIHEKGLPRKLQKKKVNSKERSLKNFLSGSVLLEFIPRFVASVVKSKPLYFFIILSTNTRYF